MLTTLCTSSYKKLKKIDFSIIKKLKKNQYTQKYIFLNRKNPKTVFSDFPDQGKSNGVLFVGFKYKNFFRRFGIRKGCFSPNYQSAILETINLRLKLKIPKNSPHHFNFKHV